MYTMTCCRETPPGFENPDDDAATLKHSVCVVVPRCDCNNIIIQYVIDATRATTTGRRRVCRRPRRSGRFSSVVDTRFLFTKRIFRLVFDESLYLLVRLCRTVKNDRYFCIFFFFSDERKNHLKLCLKAMCYTSVERAIRTNNKSE